MPRLEDELTVDLPRSPQISLDLPRSPYIALVPRLEDERRAQEIGELILDWTERALAAVLEAYHGIATVAEGLRGGGASDRKP